MRIVSLEHLPERARLTEGGVVQPDEFDLASAPGGWVLGRIDDLEGARASAAAAEIVASADAAETSPEVAVGERAAPRR